MTAAPSDCQRLQQLLLAGHPCLFIPTFEESDALTLISTAALDMRREVKLWSINGGVRDGLVAGNARVSDSEHPAAALYYLHQHHGASILVMLDLLGHLSDERVLRLTRDLIHECAERGGHLILVDHCTELPIAIKSAATTFELSTPDERDLERIVRETLRQQSERVRIQVNLDRRGLQTILRNLKGLSARQARQVILDTVCDDFHFDIGDVNNILAEKRKHLRGMGLLEYIESPVDLSEIGGLERLKSWLSRRADALTPEAEAFGITPPRGVLMLGVQGAGKSISAKAVATAWQRPLLRMDPGALFDKYIGESERRLREALRQAELMAPIVLWIDEIEKAFASAASHSTDGGLSKRMFGTLLTWMQEHTAPVFVIATANDIEALPPELLRKGRFDEIFWVDLPGLSARAAIFNIHLKKRKRDPALFDLGALAECAAGYSGAEIEQSIIAALHDAWAEQSQLNTDRIIAALRNSPPLSVTMAERIAALRAWAHGRCVRADDPA